MSASFNTLTEASFDADDLQAVEGERFHSRVVRIPAWVRDFASFRRWTATGDFPQFGRISWFAGEMEIDVNAENISFHSSVKSCLGMTLGMLVDREDLGELFGDGLRLVHEECELDCEPDLTFCSWRAFESGRADYQEKSDDPAAKIELRGTPDLVVEIVSASSVDKDKRRLRKAYFEAGIPEYWLIDARKADIEFLILKRGDGEYVESPREADGYVSSSIFQRSFQLTRTRNRVNHWKYRLEMRPPTK